MRKDAGTLVAIAAGALLAVAAAVGEPSPSTTFVDSQGDTVTKTTYDGSWENASGGVTGSYHATVFRITHAATGITDMTGVELCTCVDENGNRGTLANHMLGATGSKTHYLFGDGRGGLVNDRGTATLSNGAGFPNVDGVFNTSPCFRSTNFGRLVVGSGEAVCLLPGASQTGDIVIHRGGAFYARGADIVGRILADGPAVVSMCGNTSGEVSISGATGPVLIGEPATGDCAGNHIVGGLRIQGDTAGTDVSGNEVTGDVVLKHNVGGFVFGDLRANDIVGTVVTSGNNTKVVARPPQPGASIPVTISGAKFEATWVQSEGSGKLEVTGTIAKPARVALELRRFGRPKPLLTANASLPAGRFSLSLRLLPGLLGDGAPLLPGRFVVSIGRRSGNVVVPARLQTITLAPPPEGVVSDAFASASPGGAPQASIPAAGRSAFVHFAFQAMPKANQKLSVAWYRPGGKLIAVATKSSARVVTSSISSPEPLPAGTWHVELRAGNTVVKSIPLVVS